MTNVAVIGSGTMGNGIAHVFAQYNYKVTLIDVSEAALAKALTIIQKKPCETSREKSYHGGNKNRGTE